MLLYWGSRRCVPGDPPTNTLSWLPRHSHAGLLETLPLCRAHKDRQRSAAFAGHKRGRAGSTALQLHLTLPSCRAQVPPNPSHLRRARSPGLRAPASSRTPPFATRAAPTLGLGLKASFLSRRLGRHPAAAARAAPGRARRRRAAAVPPGPAQRQPLARPRRGPVQSAEPGMQAKNISRFQTQEARLATPSAPKTRESEP